VKGYTPFDANASSTASELPLRQLALDADQCTGCMDDACQMFAEMDNVRPSADVIPKFEWHDSVAYHSIGLSQHRLHCGQTIVPPIA